jgi:hypothetical protein
VKAQHLITKIKCLPCYRIIPSRYPPISIYERIASQDDFEDLVELESLTNPRIKEELGLINMVKPTDRISGEGAGYVMAAFTHINKDGSRFSKGDFGVYYASQTLETAIHETKYHRECFMKATQEAPIVLEMRVILADLKGEFTDIRNMDKKYLPLYKPNDYSASQAFGAEIQRQDGFGIVYKSVREPAKGECYAIFRPNILSKIRSDKYLQYNWDGQKINSVSEIIAEF